MDLEVSYSYFNVRLFIQTQTGGGKVEGVQEYEYIMILCDIPGTNGRGALSQCNIDLVISGFTSQDPDLSRKL
jgi:hypothetical protein